MAKGATSKKGRGNLGLWVVAAERGEKQVRKRKLGLGVVAKESRSKKEGNWGWRLWQKSREIRKRGTGRKEGKEGCGKRVEKQERGERGGRRGKRVVANES